MKTTVALLFGGRSCEHEISVRSARNVLRGFDTDLFDVVIVGVSREGVRSLYEDIDTQMYELVETEDSIVPEHLHALGVDVIFSVIHGTGGEDGTIQAVGKMLGISVVGCSLQASALTMHKRLTKDVLEMNGIATVPYVWFVNGNVWLYQDVVASLGEILFVKTPSLGSSVGVYKVTSEDEYYHALKQCFALDDEVLIESACDGREIEVAVLGSSPYVISPLGEIVPGSDGWYSYDEKYADSSTTTTRIVTDIDQETVCRIQEVVAQTCEVLGCDGMVRVDGFMTDAGEFLINELNTIPGFTRISMYPTLMESAGVPLSQLLTYLIDHAQSTP